VESFSATSLPCKISSITLRHEGINLGYIFHWGWQEARILVKAVYGATKAEVFRKDLRLSGQIQAAATSSMANLPG
jgi:hypothetical protein